MIKEESKAVSLYQKGYNCSQAVICAHINKYNIPEKYAFNFSAAFGNGVSGHGEICGAVSALSMLIGIDLGFDKPTKENKNLTYNITHDMIELFNKEKGSIECSDLKPVDELEKYIACSGYVAKSSEIFEYYLLHKKDLIKQYTTIKY